MQAFQPASPRSCKTEPTFSNSICPKPGKNKESRNEIQIHIVLTSPTYTEPRAKKAGGEPSPGTGRNKINILKQRKNTQQSKLSHTAWTHISILPLKEWDLEHSADGGIIGPDSYWTRTNHPQSCILNRVPIKSLTKHTKEPLSVCLETWKRSDQVPKSYALQHIKTIFLKTSRPSNAHDQGFNFSFDTKS